jgi:hypothetical protein
MPQSIQLPAVCNSKMPIGTESVICPDFETRAAREGARSVKGLEDKSNLPAIRAAIGRKFSDPNQRLTKYKRCEPHNHASDCRSSSKCFDRRRCRSGVFGEAHSSSFSSETGILESITAHLTNLEAGQTGRRLDLPILQMFK